MIYNTAYNSDIGISKKTNQDALVLLKAYTPQREQIIFAVICDGVGSMEKGERASADVVKAFRIWFCERMPELSCLQNPRQEIFQDWEQIIQLLHTTIKETAEKEGVRAGTTVEALLLFSNCYYICHVGDSRVYALSDGLVQLTRDHSFVQQEVDAGRMTEKEALRDSRQNLLLQCVGAGDQVKPDLICGDADSIRRFLVCCDGFRRRITKEELCKVCSVPSRERCMEESLRKTTKLLESRGETDNITAILIGAESAQRQWFASVMNRVAQKSDTGRFAVQTDIMSAHGNVTIANKKSAAHTGANRCGTKEKHSAR